MYSSSLDRRPFGHTSAERSIVMLILDLHNRNHTMYAIAKQLNAWGCPPRTARAWTPVYVERVLERELIHSDGDAIAIAASLESYSRCVWCGAGSELSEGKPNCIRCKHRLDVPKYKCDCKECKSDT